MKEVLRKLKLIFLALLGGYTIFALIVVILKKSLNIPDMITLSSKLTVVAMIFMLVAILGAYFIYDRLAKKSKEKEEEIDRLKLFKTAMIIKLSMFDFVGFVSAVMLLLLYQNSYLYMLGIVAVFFLINFPSEIKYKRDFVKSRDLF